MPVIRARWFMPAGFFVSPGPASAGLFISAPIRRGRGREQQADNAGWNHSCLGGIGDPFAIQSAKMSACPPRLNGLGVTQSGAPGGLLILKVGALCKTIRGCGHS